VKLGLYGGTLVAFAAQAPQDLAGCLLYLLGCPPVTLVHFETSSRKFSAARYKICDSLELFFSPHLSVGKVNSLLMEAPLRWLAEGYSCRKTEMGFPPFPASLRKGERSFLPAGFVDSLGR